MTSRRWVETITAAPSARASASSSKRTVAAGRVEAVEGLVGEQDREGPDQGQGDRGLLAHAVAEFGRQAVLPARRGRAAPEARRSGAVGSVGAVQGGDVFEVLAEAEVVVEDRACREGRRRARRASIEPARGAVHLERAAGRLEQAGGDRRGRSSCRRRWARSGRPARPAAPRPLKRAEGDEAVVFAAEAAGEEDRRRPDWSTSATLTAPPPSVSPPAARARRP